MTYTYDSEEKICYNRFFFVFYNKGGAVASWLVRSCIIKLFENMYAHIVS